MYKDSASFYPCEYYTTFKIGPFVARTVHIPRVIMDGGVHQKGLSATPRAIPSEICPFVADIVHIAHVIVRPKGLSQAPHKRGASMQVL